MYRIGVPYYMGEEALKERLSSIFTESDPYEVIIRQGTYISDIRNTLVTDSLNTLRKQPILDREGFLFIDDDVIFTKEDVNRIITLGKKHPVVFFPYRTHKNPQEYQCGTWARTIPLIASRFPVTTKFPQYVDWCGGGFLYVNKSVLETINFPYFRCEVVHFGDHSAQMGEDVGFCKQLAEHNIPIYCDFSNPVEHRLREGRYL